jgi:hypothetical protein
MLSACNGIKTDLPVQPTTFVELYFADLVLEDFDPPVLSDQEIPGCRLSNLRPFGWKIVESGYVEIRNPEEYAIQIESLYQEGYLDYQQTREEYPERYQSVPELSYDEYLQTCNVFPDVDFSRYSVLGFHATGTGCTVNFEKHVYRDDKNKMILYDLTVIEEGDCETNFNNRNLILVPRIPSDYTVEFSISDVKR